MFLLKQTKHKNGFSIVLIQDFSFYNFIEYYNWNESKNHTFVSLFLRSRSNFLPSLLLPRLVRNLSFFQACEVCWNNDTGSVFFLPFTGVFNLKVYAAVSGLRFTNWLLWLLVETVELLAIILGLRT